MSYGNTPDDWGSFFQNCTHCGRRYHASEGGCDCLDEGECVGCGETCGRECLDEDSLNSDDDKPIFRCENCGLCAGCGETVARTSMKEIDGDMFCSACSVKE